MHSLDQSPGAEEGLVVLGLPGSPASNRPAYGWNLIFRSPDRILKTRRASEIGPLLDRLQEAARHGAWAVFILAYEAAPGLDPYLAVREPGDFPLLWAAIYDRPAGPEGLPPAGSWSLGPWSPLVNREAYGRAVANIHEQLGAGESYQVNYAMPFDAPFSGHGLGFYLDTAARAACGFSAYAHLGGFEVASFSPEMFFRRAGERLEARPMKGTARRGRYPAEDEARRAGLTASPKERAENVMIVDLLRNDLGRVAVPGGVEVTELFTVETYPTVHQMTSTVTAELKPGTGLKELLAAVFPCGSVTGAPKVRTMQIIAGLEAAPREVYCGAIGYLSPDGECAASVPIRTVLLEPARGRARFWAGGGITVDAGAEAEYRECLAKMRFLTEERPGFRLLESLLLADGRYYLLDGHLRRLMSSAEYFGFALGEASILNALDEAGREHPAGRFKVRLLAGQHGDVEVQAEALKLSRPRPLRLGLARNAVDSEDVFLFHKTTNRRVYENASSLFTDADDVLLVNERGEITESCRANLVYRLDGRLCTPPLDSGLLDGVLRRRLLDAGILAERALPLHELSTCQVLWLINSVRKWLPVAEVMEGGWRRHKTDAG